MLKNNDTVQKRFEGFLRTPFLWKNSNIYDLEQINVQQKYIRFNSEINSNLRLGKYVERFVSFQLAQENNYIILAENIQIQRKKLTLGELDFIFLEHKQPIHLEVVYKFYLYDPNAGKNEIDCLMGPNKKDSLNEKLTKLKEKQLPLLYCNESINILKNFNINIKTIKQKVYFKAQIFVPYNSTICFTKLNSDCIMGFYISRHQLAIFKNCKFYIPSKKDWLIKPHSQVAWLNFTEFSEQSYKYLETHFSPLCWLKNKNGVLSKFFLIW